MFLLAYKINMTQWSDILIAIPSYRLLLFLSDFATG